MDSAFNAVNSTLYLCENAVNIKTLNVKPEEITIESYSNHNQSHNMFLKPSLKHLLEK